MIIDYVILESHDRQELRAKVIDIMLKDCGWIPQGGVSTIIKQDNSSIIYSQAMVLVRT